MRENEMLLISEGVHTRDVVCSSCGHNWLEQSLPLKYTILRKYCSSITILEMAINNAHPLRSTHPVGPTIWGLDWKMKDLPHLHMYDD